MISAPFAQVLAAGRSQFNKQVVEARRRYPAFDTAAFADFLQTGVDAVVGAVAVADADRVPQVALAAYGIALELTGQSLAGPKARGVGVNRVWREVAPLYARLIAAWPAEVLGLLTNAVIHLEKSSAARPAQWLREIARMSPHVTSLAQLQALGQVLAWRAGLAHFRLGALAAADKLPAPLLQALFNNTQDWPALRERMRADPWWGVDAASAAISVGAFTGFGGEFAAPPQVRGCDDGFLVRSGERHFLLVADAHGAVLHAACEDEFEHAARQDWGAVPPLNGATLRIDGHEIALELPPGQIALARNAHTLAVSSPFTHAIRLLPLR